MASAASPNRAALKGWPIACLQSPLLRRSIAVAAEVIQPGGLPNEQSLLDGPRFCPSELIRDEWIPGVEAITLVTSLLGVLCNS